MKCKFCGRETEDRNGICEYCEPFVCEICGARLSRGYCAICGRLVCTDDFKFVGFARVCIQCLENNPKLIDYNYFLKLVFSRAREVTSYASEEFTKVMEFGVPPSSEHLHVHIGLDDFDSPYGLCTTYVMAKLLQALKERFSIELLDFPLLVRLNPNIPLKTRGNASVAARFRIHKADVCDLVENVCKFVGNISHKFFKKTQPALVVYLTDKYAIDKVLNWAYMQSVKSVLPPKILLKKLSEIKIGQLMVFSPRLQTPRGIVGAIAAIGAAFDDYTFELIAYRKRENIWMKRQVDENSVIEMNSKLFPLVFGNIDGKRVLIVPRGPDPVLFGIRGEAPEVVYEAFKIIKHEDIDLWTIFRTNQATSSHIRSLGSNIEDAHPYETVTIDCKVVTASRKNDKIILKARAGGILIEGFAYKLQRQLQSNLLKLRQDDVIRLIIAIMDKRENIIRGNIEEIIPLKLKPELIKRNPRCPRCCSRLKKKSKNEMYCKKCGLRIPGSFKIEIKYPRSELRIHKRYLPSPRAYRHLTMPNERVYFRFQKLLGKIRAYLTEPVLAENKELTLVKVLPIKDPEIS
ncbi:MAG: DUF1743 domain-containing protein [Crenarchaeota archaeon]|nr:DUF1743 domain-containing protein [Thermoproteota archaeon]MCR8470904.1 DUF1743 domain-containing protein [Thermoproteota archaeon]MCR8473196.1 DUF1743 domain-containing protein [Thermoproteota archaeon]MCR8488931.1 DUF1743 domain-containing protein [Thermoproteota archaeon]